MLIRLIKIQALPEFFALDFEICTTDFVNGEILESEQREQIEIFIRSKTLTVFDLSENEIEEVVNFKTKRFFKTLIDKTVLWKAKQLNCPLLTGDAKLRSEAEENGIKVHGSLWVIRMIVEQKIISAKSGVEYLKKLKIINDRLPQEEIERLNKKIKVMKIKMKEDHAGVMTLNDGTKANYGTIRVTQNMSKLIYYTGKGLRDIFKPDMNEEKKQKAEELKKLDEKTLMKLGHISEFILSEIKELT